MIVTHSPPCPELSQIAADRIKPDPLQPRKTIPEDNLQRLRESLRARGQLSPLRVRLDETTGDYIIINGETRYRAGLSIGWESFACIVASGGGDEVDILIDQIADNEIRFAVSPIEQAKAFQRVQVARGWSGVKMSEMTGFHKSTISKSLKLLKLPPTVQKLVDSGHVPASSGYELAKLDDVPTIEALAEAIKVGDLCGNAVGEAVKAVRDGKPKSERTQRDRLSLPVERGKLSLISDQEITWDVLDAAIERIRKVARVHKSNGGLVETLADELRKL